MIEIKLLISELLPSASYPAAYSNAILRNSNLVDFTLSEVKDNIAEDVVLDYVFMQAYGMGLIIEYCISACKTLNEQVLRQFAETADIETVFGRFKIDPQTGVQVGHRMVLVQWNNGKKYALTGVEGTWIPLGYESS